MTEPKLYSLLQWNVWYLEDAHNTVALLREYMPDVVCLQELTRTYDRQSVPDVAAFVAQELGYNYEVVWYPLANGAEGGNAVLSRYPLSEPRVVWTLPETAPEPRTYLECSVHLPGNKLQVATTHALYTDAFSENDHKLSEADALVAAIGANRQRYVFAGDLNATPESYMVQRVVSRLQNAGPIVSEPTWTTKPFSYNGFEASTLSRRLDYVFVSDDVRAVSAQVVPTDYSDHLPIYVQFSL